MDSQQTQLLERVGLGTFTRYELKLYIWVSIKWTDRTSIKCSSYRQTSHVEYLCQAGSLQRERDCCEVASC